MLEIPVAALELRSLTRVVHIFKSISDYSLNAFCLREHNSKT